MGDLLRRLDQALMPLLARALYHSVTGRTRRAVLATVGVVAATVALLAVVMAARAPVPGQGVTAGNPVRVGIVDGESIPAYAAAAQAKLTGLSSGQPTFALVSFAAYLAPDRLEHLLGSVPLSRVYLRVPLPRLDTEIIPIEVHGLPGDIVAAMEAAAERREADGVLAQELAAKVAGDGPQERELRAVYAARAQQAAAETTAYREHCSCVYAAVVRAEPATLTWLSQRPGVLTVDPSPGLGRLEQAVFLPPTPEQWASVASTGARPAAPDSRAPRALPRR